jgi:hypothetical protein
VHQLRGKAIASARLKNGKGRRRAPATAAARGPAPEAWIGPDGDPPTPGAAAAPGSAWSASAPSSVTGSTWSSPATAMTGPPVTGPGRAAAGWLAELDLPAASQEIVNECLAINYAPISLAHHLLCAATADTW